MAKSALSVDSERKMPGFGDESLPHDIFSPAEGAVATYVALGHLHLAQRISECDWIRYSGSPLPFSSSESDYPHQVLLVDLDGDVLSEVTSLLVPSELKREMITVPALPHVDEVGAERKSAPLMAVLKELSKLPDLDESVAEWRRPLLQVKVFSPEPDPTIKSKVLSALRDKHARLIRIHSEYPQRSNTAIAELPKQNLSDINPDDIFRARWRDRKGSEPSDEFMEAYREIRDEARIALKIDQDQINSSVRS